MAESEELETQCLEKLPHMKKEDSVDHMER